MELKEMIKVMQHYADGEEVEVRFKDDDNDTWEEPNGTLWNWSVYDYRIKKQKQKVTIEKWLIKNVDSGDHFIMESSDVDLTLKAFPDGCKVKLIKSYEVKL